MRSTGTSRDAARARAHRGSVYSPIINRSAFTLIELLVVISVIALLVSILLPSLQRTRRQAQAAGCQSNLHQWGVVLYMYANDDPDLAKKNWWPSIVMDYTVLTRDHMRDSTKKIAFCPGTVTNKLKYVNPYSLPDKIHSDADPKPVNYLVSSFETSYGANLWFTSAPLDETTLPWAWHWQTFDIRGGTQVPLLLDCSRAYGVRPKEHDPPAPLDYYIHGSSGMSDFCLNRHYGGPNCLFADWSVRKVGVKELWALKWHRQFNTEGPWTKRGGVKPEDWPQWMRKFKDY